MLRSVTYLFLAVATLEMPAQVLRGQIAPVAASRNWIVLFDTYGSTHHAIDSARIDAIGSFQFAQRVWHSGFHQLGVGDDRIELILGTPEPLVEVRLDGVPLQEHITVVQSAENQRLWEYKRASREGQLRLERISAQRASASPIDHVLLDRLRAEESEVQRWQRSALDRMIEQDPLSYFTRVVLTDRRLMTALDVGTLAIRDAVNWDDPGLVHSAVYEKAVMAVLQSTTPASPEILASASDSILAWASPDTTCWRFARFTLSSLFATYGPPDVVQHIVDRYVMGPSALLPPEPELLLLAAEHLRVSIGSPAPDIILPSPAPKDTSSLRALAEGHRATVLFFYSSTCDHCHEQMPGLQSTYEEFGPKGLQVIGVALDDDRQTFQDNLEKMRLTFPCFTELTAWGSLAAKAFAVRATPSYFVLDDSLKIAAKPYDVAELRAFLDQVLKKR